MRFYNFVWHNNYKIMLQNIQKLYKAIFIQYYTLYTMFVQYYKEHSFPWSFFFSRNTFNLLTSLPPGVSVELQEVFEFAIHARISWKKPSC